MGNTTGGGNESPTPESLNSRAAFCPDEIFQSKLWRDIGRIQAARNIFGWGRAESRILN